MLELLWVSDAGEAQCENTRRTLLWERWFGRRSNASPFGICVRPADRQEAGAPFSAWEYRPAYLPDSLSMQIGEAGLEEPMWIHLGFMRRSQREEWFTEHPNGIREITHLTLTTGAPLRSEASQKMVESGVLAVRTGTTPLLEIEFDGHRRQEQADFRPHLPVIFQV